jgi:hypothetical protein
MIRVLNNELYCWGGDCSWCLTLVFCLKGPIPYCLGLLARKLLLFWQLALQPDMEKELQGVVVSSAAVKVKPAHPVIGVSHSCSLCSSLGFVHSIKIDALGFVYAYQVFPSF